MVLYLDRLFQCQGKNVTIVTVISHCSLSLKLLQEEDTRYDSRFTVFTCL